MTWLPRVIYIKNIFSILGAGIAERRRALKMFTYALTATQNQKEGLNCGRTTAVTKLLLHFSYLAFHKESLYHETTDDVNLVTE